MVYLYRQGEILLSHDTSGAAVGSRNKRELRKAWDDL